MPLHARVSLGTFGTRAKQEKAVTGTEAMKVLIPFSVMFLREQGFPTPTAIKTESETSSTVCMTSVLALCKVELRFLE